jgi:formate dehydrogenase maturation protein FdhE
MWPFNNNYWKKQYKELQEEHDELQTKYHQCLIINKSLTESCNERVEIIKGLEKSAGRIASSINSVLLPELHQTSSDNFSFVMAHNSRLHWAGTEDALSKEKVMKTRELKLDCRFSATMMTSLLDPRMQVDAHLAHMVANAAAKSVRHKLLEDSGWRNWDLSDYPEED